MEIADYSIDKKDEWDHFLETSKSPVFLFKRDYMEYHSDRYTDKSLMFYENGKLIAILPANIDNTEIVSHGGLTFGGLITDCNMKQHKMNDVIRELRLYIQSEGLDGIIYKEIPYIYQNVPDEEDEYSIFWNDAKIIKMESSTVVNLKHRLKMPKGRKAQISRARRENVIIQDSNDYEEYIRLENEVLGEYHDAKAAHTGKELSILHDRFPENIRLVVGIHEDRMIAGAVLYLFPKTVRTQYLAANDEARHLGALDLVISEVLDQYEDDKEWFDFGKSTEGDGSILNEGLKAQKEGFGGRTVVYRTWKMGGIL